MDDFPARLRALADLNVAEFREEGGRHEYDGRPADLSPEGVRTGLERVGTGDRFADPHDEAHVRAFEDAFRYEFAELELHRSNPVRHIDELDLAGYAKEYAPEAERQAARERHLAAWPAVIDAAIASLDQVSAPVAAACLAPARGLAQGIPDNVPEEVRAPALEAHGRFLAHLERAAETGNPSAALGGTALARMMGIGEAAEVDLERLAERADAERDRLMHRLAESTARIDPGRAPLEVVGDLVRDHPDADGVLDAARTWTAHAIAFTRERDLVPLPRRRMRRGPLSAFPAVGHRHADLVGTRRTGGTDLLPDHSARPGVAAR